MKKTRLLSALSAVVFSLCDVVPAEAIMISRLGGAAAYDTALDITWTTDGRLQPFALNWYDTVAWAESLAYLGFDDWRLASMSVSATGPTTSPIHCSQSGELACRDNELGYMFYYNLGGHYGLDLTGDQMAGEVELKNIQHTSYWSGTEFPSERPEGAAWRFSFDRGTDRANRKDVTYAFGWAVRDGDVVPEPPIVLLLATSLLGLIWASRKKSAK